MLMPAQNAVFWQHERSAVVL